ncbi:hypothetical protein TNCT6_77810 [Streptomyces sp. 6-11-2]|nr:hypothetical protein TNCT6_77810 [Streptomyces sp. 6-11-2]
MLVQDPARPGRLLTHRVYQVRPNNDLITKGDANSAPDSTPIRLAALRGVARLRVPGVGLPVQLWRAELGRRRQLCATFRRPLRVLAQAVLRSLAAEVGPLVLTARSNVTGRRSVAVLSWVGRRGVGERPRRPGRRAVAKRRRPMPCCTAARSVT